MVSRFNIYFNANQLLERSKESLEKGHKDNFSDMISVFPYGTESQGQSQASTLEEAMKKCSRIIQEKPKSKWVDDSYLLIGKAHYYKADPGAALQMFQYVYSLYKDKPIQYEAQVWILRSKVRLGKLNDAEALYSLIRENKEFPKELEKQLLLAAGELYVKQKKYSTATKVLTRSVPMLENRDERYRIHFLLGQLNAELGNQKKSAEHFVKCIRQTPPYDYAFQANLGIASASFAENGANLKTAKKYLRRMLQDDKNLDYYDQIYYQLGLIEQKEGNEDEAIALFKQSTANSKGNKIQQTDAYIALANIYFDRTDYENAQIYFDSASMVVEESHPNYEDIQTRQATLSDLVNQLVTIQRQDSFLKLAALPRPDLDRLIDKKYKKDLEEEQARKEAAEKAKEEEYFKKLYNSNNRNNPNNPNDPNSQQVATGNGSDWYFYNTIAIARGYNEFVRVWGDRKYGDWWRVSSRKPVNDNLDKPDDPKDEEPTESDVITYNEKDDKEQQKVLASVDKDKREYYRPIPFSKAGKSVAKNKIENALYDAAKIYKNKLNDCSSQNKFLNRLVSEFPESFYRPEALFMLYKCHEETGDDEQIKEVKRMLVEEYPESNYTAVVTKKELPDESGENQAVIDSYERMYNTFMDGDYNQAKSIKIVTDSIYPGNRLQAKFDYLYALCVAKTEGKEAYKENLEYLVDAYKGTEIGEIAQLALDQMNPKRELDEDGPQFEKSKGVHYLVITLPEGEFGKVGTTISDFNGKFYPSDNLKVQNTILGDRDFAWVKQFKNPVSALQYMKTLQESEKLMAIPAMKSARIYVISEENFRTLLMEQNDDGYYSFYRRTYL